MSVKTSLRTNIIGYNDFKEASVKFQPLTRSASLIDLDVIDATTMSFKGHTFTCEPKAIQDLNKILGMPVAISTLFEQKLGPEMKAKLQSLVKIARTMGGKDLECTVVISNVTKSIMRVLKGNSLLNNKTFFDTFEKLTTDADWTIDAMAQGPDGGVSISVMNKNSEFQVGAMKDEIFYPGFTLSSNQATGMSLDMFNHRLVCSNGMTRKDVSKSLRYIDFKTPTEFFDKLLMAKDSNFVSTGFADDVIKASKTRASFAELEHAAMHIKHASNCPLDQIDQFIPYNSIRHQFAAKGLDTITLNSAQKGNAITNVSIWDLVNGLTDFASHDYSYEISGMGRSSMQAEAGKLLGKKSFDIDNLVHVSL